MSTVKVLLEDEAKRDGRESRWTEHRAETRERLILSTIDAIRRHGAGVRMDTIASEASTSKAVFYRYFSDKTDLHLAVGTKLAGELAEELMAVLDPAGEPDEMIRRGIDTYLGLIEAEPNLYEYVMHSPASSRNTNGDPVSDYMTILGSQVAQIVGDRLRADGLDSGAADPWGFAIVGMVRAAGDRWLKHRTMSRVALVDYLTDLLWRGIGLAALKVPTPDEMDSPLKVVGGRK